MLLDDIVLIENEGIKIYIENIEDGNNVIVNDAVIIINKI